MSRLVFKREQLLALRTQLLQEADVETCAILLGRSVHVRERLARIIVREILIPEPSAYEERSRVRARLRPTYVAEVVQRARRDGNSVGFVHTHPFSYNEFSEIDDAGEALLAEFLKHRIPEAPHVALLLTPEVSTARELGSRKPLVVVGVGPETFWGKNTAAAFPDDRYDRQVRAFGAAGQAMLRSLRVGIVGLGGTGSIVLQQLAHLGVKEFVLLDPDTVEATNLNRLVGAGPADVSKAKTQIAALSAQRIDPEIRCECRNESVLQASVARSLADVDFVFGCTDSNGSRAVLNQVAYQYMVPTIDMGVVIAAPGGAITHIAGRTQLLAPGLACLTCANLLDAEQVRRDLLTDYERQVDPYITGTPEPAPSVISLNSTIASLAVTMFLDTLIGTPGRARFLNYNGLSGTVRPALCSPHPSCVVCSPAGALARGDEWPLAARYD